MKYELLNFLACPVCKLELILRESLKENGEVIEGFLVCTGCKREFPIRGGIPRMVTGLEEKSTGERFGYEWMKFPQLSRLYERQFLDWINPIEKDFFRGKVVLDAGCGKGRHIYLTSHFGARTVIGIEVGEAIEVAYANTRDLNNVHLIQADIYHPPLRRAFDYIYSIGVLHHLPKPEDGFKSLSGLLKSSGTISVWVYGREGNGWIVYLVNPLRRFLTSKMPLPALKKISFPIAFLLYVMCKFLYKPINLHFKSLRRFLFYNDYMFYISDFELGEIHSIVFDHLLAPISFYLEKDAVIHWFNRYEFGDIQIAWHNKNSWRAMGYLR
jgi:uncharacterized protein YbaR (Trm112 family)/ubiquinone/menaquinone biosynthesis C-methylase UbiE